MDATATTYYGFSNIDISKQIAVRDNVFAGISRANQTISIYHGETLVADCTMPSAGLEFHPTIIMDKPTLHDETFTGFVDGETYTIVAGDEPPITGFVKYGDLFSFDINAMWFVGIINNRLFAQDYSASRANYTISQKITTTKKRYDIKRLPEELLPKTAATKAEVRKAQSTAEAAKVEGFYCSDSTGERYFCFEPKDDPGNLHMLFGHNVNGLEIRIDETRPKVVFYPPVKVGYQSDFHFGRRGTLYRHPNIAGIGGVIMYSSTPNSTKQFKITVDDSGVISATEVVE